MPINFVTGLGAFTTLYASAKALKDMNDATVRNGAVMDLQEKILAAQLAQAELVAQVRELEERVRNFEIWEAQKQRYELNDLGWGSFAYI